MADDGDELPEEVECQLRGGLPGGHVLLQVVGDVPAGDKLRDDAGVPVVRGDEYFLQATCMACEAGGRHSDQGCSEPPPAQGWSCSAWFISMVAQHGGSVSLLHWNLRASEAHLQHQGIWVAPKTPEIEGLRAERLRRRRRPCMTVHRIEHFMYSLLKILNSRMLIEARCRPTAGIPETWPCPF